MKTLTIIIIGAILSILIFGLVYADVTSTRDITLTKAEKAVIGSNCQEVNQIGANYEIVCDNVRGLCTPKKNETIGNAETRCLKKWADIKINPPIKQFIETINIQEQK